MRRAELYTYIFFCIASVVMLLWLIPRFTPEGIGMGMAPATLPNVLSVIILIFSLSVIVKNLKSAKQAGQEIPSPLPLSLWVHLALFGFVLFCTMPLMAKLGFLPGTFISLTCLQLLSGQKKIIVLLFVSISTSLILWGALHYLLNVPLPS